MKDLNKKKTRNYLIFSDGIGIRFWHHFDSISGTAIRFQKAKPGVFGLCFMNHGMYLGFWWSVKISLVAIHMNRFLVSDESFKGGI